MTIELPKDAEGREIPLDTTVLYDKDGSEMCVKRIEFDPFEKEWSFAIRKGLPGGIVVYRRPRVVYLEKPAPPDSWEKLLEDLDRMARCCAISTPACVYTQQQCSVCEFHNSESCTSAMCADIASRIRKLRGED